MLPTLLWSGPFGAHQMLRQDGSLVKPSNHDAIFKFEQKVEPISTDQIQVALSNKVTEFWLLLI
jgi:hypothetical protein